MSGPRIHFTSARETETRGRSDATLDPVWARVLLIGVAVSFLAVLLVAPLAIVFTQAFARGWRVYLAALVDPEAAAAIRLSLLAAASALGLNTAFGLVAAWALGNFEFRGRSLLITLIGLPFAISPVVAGLIFVLVFGLRSGLGEWLATYDVRIIFAVPGIVLATVFVTLPFVARELIPILEARGTGDEEAARLMGASGLQIFRWVTLPNLRWGLLYGMILCNARALGEFGAVSIVSGHIRGRTNTLPLHVEILYNEYQFAAAFAVASLLTFLALVTLIIKTWVERRARASMS